MQDQDKIKRVAFEGLPGDVPVDVTPSREGYLTKLTNTVRGWRKRYFYLEDGLLSYTKSKDKASKGAVSLMNSVVLVHKTDPTRFDIDTGAGSVFHLRASSPEERNDWIRDIKRTKSALEYIWRKSQTQRSAPQTAYQKTVQKANHYQGLLKAQLRLLEKDLKKHKPLGNVSKIDSFNSPLTPAQKSQDFVDHAKSFYNVTVKLLSLAAQMSEQTPSEESKTDESEYDGVPDNVSDDGALGWKSPAGSDSEDSAEYFSPNSSYDDLRDRIEHALSNRVTAPQFESLTSSSEPTSSYTPCLPNHLDKFFAKQPAVTARHQLPPNEQEVAKPVMTQFFKSFVGRDVDSLHAIPVEFFEPLSNLQRFSECLEYSEVLDQAAQCSESMDRLLHVTVFAIANYAHTAFRFHKPFNALLGETFEFVDTKRGVRAVIEQVSVKPRVAAMQAESKEWCLWSHMGQVNRFWGKSLEMTNTGRIHVSIQKHGDHFVWNRVTSFINHLLYGQKSVDHEGEMRLMNKATKEKGIITWSARGVTAELFDGSETLRFRVLGNWHTALTATAIKADGAEGHEHVVWKVKSLGDPSAKRWGMTAFAASLNELPEPIKSLVPLTDSRLRKDIRALEAGQLEEAAQEHQRLTKKEKSREENNAAQHVKWFMKTKEEGWIYKGGYFEHREFTTWDSDAAQLFN